MGYSQPHPDYPTTTYWYKQGKEPLTILSFDSDWNWLMEVIAKIESLGNDIAITSNYIQITYNDGESFISVELKGSIMLQAVYISAVKFITWYNEQNKQKNYESN